MHQAHGRDELEPLDNGLPIQVHCQGEGHSGQSGELTLTIDNLNSVSLTQLCLYISELTELKTGYHLDTEIPAGKKVLIPIPISNYPALPPNHQGRQLSLTGELRFKFAGIEAGTARLDSASLVIVKQLFSSGLDINDFLQ